MKEEKKYAWNPEEYAKHSSAQQQWARELISKLNLKGDESVLDIGCGDGKVTAEIGSYLTDGRITGVDNSADMIRLAAKKFTPHKNPNLSLEVADARNLPFREEFDIVFSNAALHWIREHKPVIQSIRESLKPGGRMLLQMGGKGNAAAIVSVLEVMAEQDKWNAYFEGFQFPYGFHGDADYAAWLLEAGISPIRVELIPKDMTYDTREGLAGWVRTTWLPYTERVPANLREAFISELVENYVAQYPPDKEGNIHVKMVRLEVEAKRET